ESPMKVAALYDIHGNIDALEAVLAEVEPIRPDAIVIGGDAVAGPFPTEVLARLRALPNAHWIRGNTEREVVGPAVNVPPMWVDRVRWVYVRLAPEQRDFLIHLPEKLVLDV